MANTFSNFLFGSPQTTKQIPNFSTEQMQARQQLRGMGLNSLQNNPLSFAPIKQQYEKQFNEEVIPTLAERFAGNLSSGAFKGALGNTTSDFYSKLAGLESQYNLGARQQGLRELLSTLNPEFENLLQPRQPGFLENLGVAASQGLGSYLTGGISGGLSGLSSLFAPQQATQSNQNTEIVPLLRQLLALLGGNQ